MSNLRIGLELNNGTMLFKAIKEDDPIMVDEAIEHCRKEVIKQRTNSKDFNKDFESMQVKLIRYLTARYNIEGGMFSSTETPEQYARSLGSDRAATKIKEAIIRLQAADLKAPVKVSKTVGIVDSDRAATAKEKLLAYKNQREQGPNALQDYYNLPKNNSNSNNSKDTSKLGTSSWGWS